jgi:hypothetical protein
MTTSDPAARAEILRSHVTRAIQHGTDLIADLQALARAFEVLVPQLAEATERERWAEVSRITGLDSAMPEDLEALIETLADVLAGLTSTDGGEGWLQHQRTRLQSGEDATAA